MALEPKYPTSCVDRFLKYVKIDTRSDVLSETYPSTPGQWDLLRLLADELKELGAEDVSVDEYGYVFATVPSTSEKAQVPVVGFLAHVDTSPEVSGKDVKPLLHENYDGKDIELPFDDAVVRVSENPHLREQIGRTVITSSGDTLLGADNKAGVAEIMGAVEYLLAHPEILHGPIRVGFTPDEEIGKGTQHFNVHSFGAACAYTMDGESLGEVQDETFSADGLNITFQGVNAHPGFAKGVLVNALKMAGTFLERLPKERLSPETTSGYEGFVHPYMIDGGVETCRIRMVIRDFQTSELLRFETELQQIAEQVVLEHPGGALNFEVEEQYRNMKEVLAQHPRVVDHAVEAIRRADLEPRRLPIRGGTDGSRLCFMGLPTPNIFAGEHNFHSRGEWVSTYDMHKAVEVIIELAKLWEEQP